MAVLRHYVTGWVDTLYQRLHGKRYLPPWSLRFTVGSPADFEATGAEFLAYLKLLCGLKAQHRIFDIGCGCGMMALPLRDYLSSDGRYVGMDIDRRAIDWCQAHVAAHDSRFAFYHADLQNPRYNPQATTTASSYLFPELDASFDVILLKSVLTHMQPDGLRNYLNEIARLLKPGARCLATFFLLNEVQAALAQQGRSALNFEHGDDDCRYVNPDLPEQAVAYREGFVLDVLSRSGLALAAPPHYGTWSGRSGGLSFQDVLLVTQGD